MSKLSHKFWGVLNRCEDCHTKLNQFSKVYLGFSSYKTVCSECSDKYNGVIPRSFETVVFDEYTDGTPIYKSEDTK